ncbi:hypothetical protein MBLNU459_g8111t1 [Dothideomycetes sp. NU459]
MSSSGVDQSRGVSYSAPPETKSYVELQLLNGGSFTAERHKINAGAKADKFRLYNWCFYIQNRAKGKHVLWDLGMTANKSDYATFVGDYIFDETRPCGPSKTIAEQLRQRNGLDAKDIDSVVFSHAHFDHSRPIKDEFPNATGYFGPGTKEHCTPGHLEDPSQLWDGRFFDPKRSTERWETLPGPWVPFGSFEKALDFFGDGSFWIMQAPGHMPGNLCAAARLDSGAWVILGSDCCHSSELYSGACDFAMFDTPGGKSCLHSDLPSAKDSLRRIKVMESEFGAHVAFAHITQWMQDGKDDVLMSLLDNDMRMAAKELIPYEKTV